MSFPPCEVCGDAACDNHYATPTLCFARLRARRDFWEKAFRAERAAIVDLRDALRAELAEVRKSLDICRDDRKSMGVALGHANAELAATKRELGEAKAEAQRGCEEGSALAMECGSNNERIAIAAWLRDLSARSGSGALLSPAHAADAIERGEHLLMGLCPTSEEP